MVKDDKQKDLEEKKIEFRSKMQQKIDFYNDNDEEWQMAKVRAYAQALSLFDELFED